MSSMVDPTWMAYLHYLPAPSPQSSTSSSSPSPQRRRSSPPLKCTFFTCQECGRTFTTQQGLAGHASVHVRGRDARSRYVHRARRHAVEPSNPPGGHAPQPTPPGLRNHHWCHAAEPSNLQGGQAHRPLPPSLRNHHWRHAAEPSNSHGGQAPRPPVWSLRCHPIARYSPNPPYAHPLSTALPRAIPHLELHDPNVSPQLIDVNLHPAFCGSWHNVQAQFGRGSSVLTTYLPNSQGLHNMNNSAIGALRFGSSTDVAAPPKTLPLFEGTTVANHRCDGDHKGKKLVMDGGESTMMAGPSNVEVDVKTLDLELHL